MIEIFAIIALIFVIGAQFADRWLTSDKDEREKKRLLDELEKANAALVSKSAQEYVMMRSMDKVRDEEKKEQPEGVDVSELSDEEYDKMLKENMKAG